jgi:hypothetical protein
MQRVVPREQELEGAGKEWPVGRDLSGFRPTGLARRLANWRERELIVCVCHAATG